MKIVVLGYTGMLGRYVYTYLKNRTDHNVVGIGRKHLDVSRLHKINVEDVLDLSENDYVINCIGILKPNIPEVGELPTILINTIFPQILSEICNLNKARLIHISSDCVYSGKAGPYNEQSDTDADDLYGRTKSIDPDSCITLRTSIIGEEPSPSPKGLLEFVRSSHNKTIPGYTNCFWKFFKKFFW